MDIDQILQHAINLIQAGNKADGRELLRQAIQSEPDSADAWFVYAQYCGKRDQAIESLERVLALDPYYPGAREALESITATPIQTPPAAPASSQPNYAYTPAFTESVEYSWEENAPANSGVDAGFEPGPAQPQDIEPKTLVEDKNPLARLPKWAVYVGIGVTVLMCLAGFGIGLIAALGNSGALRLTAPTAIPAAPAATITPLVFVDYTPTPDPCTCDTVNAYLLRFSPRFSIMVMDMNTFADKMDQGAFSAEDMQALVESTNRLYEDQRAEQPPYCAESFQKDAVKTFWDWQQTALALQNGDKQGALTFLDTVKNESNNLGAEMDKLAANPKLQGCNLIVPQP